MKARPCEMGSRREGERERRKRDRDECDDRIDNYKDTKRATNEIIITTKKKRKKRQSKRLMMPKQLEGRITESRRISIRDWDPGGVRALITWWGVLVQKNSLQRGI